MVTEAEIRDAIRRPLGARSVSEVKLRTRAGMGRCQGGFCGPRVVEILCEELRFAARSDAVRRRFSDSGKTGMQWGGTGMRKVDLVVIGGGAAGMAAAVSAYRSGVKDVLILERNDYLGGVLQQCIHNGFGLHRFEEDLTGVEFARKYRDMVEELKIPYLLHTFVIEMNENRQITAINPEEGLIQIEAKAIVLAMGCRERTRNNLLIPGTRGAGILTAGAAQRYLNINGYLPGKKVVILGSGDIGLIMARQFVLEGAEVEAVVEVMPYSGGLPRNMKQCIEDFDIPVYYNSTVSEIRGKERVSSVMVSRVDEKTESRSRGRNSK